MDGCEGGTFANLILRITFSAYVKMGMNEFVKRVSRMGRIQ